MSDTKRRIAGWWAGSIIGLIAVYAIGFLHGRYVTHEWPFAWVKSEAKQSDHNHDEGHSHTSLSDSPFAKHFASTQNESEHDHESGHTHADGTSLAVSETALKNLGLTEEFLRPLELQTYTRSYPVPSMIVDRPGRTRLPVSAPMTGIVTHVHAVTGEAIKPGELLLEMRLTHEDLVTAQKEYLQTLGERDVELKQIARIEGLATAGAVANKTLVERQFNRDKLDTQLKSQREALRLHGLTDEQIDGIDQQRRLLTEIRIVAPMPDEHSDDEVHLSQLRQSSELNPESQQTPFRVTSSSESQRAMQSADQGKERLLVLQELHAQKGQIMNAGDPLCVLADYQELQIEGQAFESEIATVTKAKLSNWPLVALVGEGADAIRIENLHVTRVDNEINPATRTLKFYVDLENELVDSVPTSDGHQHVTWRFRTGQRLQIQLPIEQWQDVFVLPPDAVVREGLESFVFQQNGDHFDRVSVHEKYRDPTSVVIANDGVLYPGDVVALRGAYQMQLAMKNQAGGAVDPHAGHNH